MIAMDDGRLECGGTTHWIQERNSKRECNPDARQCGRNRRQPEPLTYTASHRGNAIRCALITLILVVGCFFSQPLRSDELPSELQQAQNERIAAIARASRTAVSVFGPGSRGGGSGVVISPDGYAVTNFHVVQSCEPFMKCSMPDGVLYDAVIVGIDPTGDVALIKLLGRDDFPFAQMANSDDVQAGEYCFAVGNPFLLATNFEPTVSWGIVSGVHRYQYPSGTILEYTDCIQTDAAINPGNSGGPLFNAAGGLIGINGRGSFEKRGRVNVGVGYAISINQVKNFLSHLKSGRIVDHATLGATVATDDEGTVRVSDILESSEAFRRGLAYDDEIVSFAGREIQTVNQFKNVLGIYPKGWKVPIVFRRDGVEREIKVRLTGVHATEELVEMIEGPPRKKELPQPKPKSKKAKPAKQKSASNAPEAYKHLYRKRAGFTNYYFNLENRDRIWNGFLGNGDFSRQASGWRLTGVDSQNRPIVIVLRDNQSGIRIDGESFVLDPDQDLSQQLMPRESGGLLVALHLWRTMLVLGPEKFGDVYYLGRIPSFSNGPDGEVLIATRGAIESNFIFDASDFRLASMEMFPDVNSDPCELNFANYQVDGDLAVPGTIRFSTGNQQPNVITIEQIEFLENEPSRESLPTNPDNN